MMSRQEIFTTVYNGLKSQDFEKCGYSTDQGVMQHKTTFICMYRHEDKKCAFGHLIPDDLYSPLIEHQSAFGLITNSCASDIQWDLTNAKTDEERKELYEKLDAAKKISIWSEKTFDNYNTDFIQELQQIHDRSETKEQMIEELTGFANKYSLLVPLDNIT